jgi:pantetheine-phosphate adenylyltransferase
MIAVYAGTFDPITRGHADIIGRARLMFDRVVIAVGDHPEKRTLFRVAERVDLIQRVVFVDATEMFPLRVVPFRGLLVHFCKSISATVIVRGLRALTDYEYELAMAHANRTQAPEIETVFIPTAPDLSFVSSSAAKEVAKFGGDCLPFVHPEVCDALKEKFK